MSRKILALFMILALFAAAGRYLVYSDELHPVDVIVALSGNDEKRIRETADLYKDRIADHIMLTNSNATYGEYNLPYSVLQKEILHNYEIPETAVQMMREETRRLPEYLNQQESCLFFVLPITV